MSATFHFVGDLPIVHLRNRSPYLSGETSPREIQKRLRLQALHIPNPKLQDIETGNSSKPRGPTGAHVRSLITAGVELSKRDGVASGV